MSIILVLAYLGCVSNARRVQMPGGDQGVPVVIPNGQNSRAWTHKATSDDMDRNILREGAARAQLAGLLKNIVRLSGGSSDMEAEEPEAPEGEAAFSPSNAEEEVSSSEDNAFSPSNAEEEVSSSEDNAEPAPHAASEPTSGVQFVVTAKMREQLAQLGYNSDDIAKLAPERASAIISRGIRCPSTGAPQSWTTQTKGKTNPALKVMRVAVAPAVFGALAAVSHGMGPFTRHQRRAKEPVGSKRVPRLADPDDTWLDQQIDKIIEMVKVLLSGN